MSWLDSFFGNTFTVSYGGVALPKQPILDFEGAGITVADDPTNGRTVATVAGGGSGGGLPPPVRFAFGTGGGTSSTAPPSGSRILRAAVEVTTPFTPGTTLSLGKSGSISLIFGTGTVDSALGVAGLTPIDLDVLWSATAALLATVAGASVGAGQILVWYATVAT